MITTPTSEVSDLVSIMFLVEFTKHSSVISNIDSAGSPTSFLVPISENIVDNEVTIGVVKPMVLVHALSLNSTHLIL